MKAFVLRLLLVFLTTFLVVLVVPGIVIRGPLVFLLIFMIAFVNAGIKFVLVLSSVGCNILALGPILLILNTMLLWLIGQIGIGVIVTGFWPAFWGGMIISLVSFVLNVWIRDGL